MEFHRILPDLDKHASEFNFPVLDNAYVEYAGGRLSAFRGALEWLIVFEVLGFSTRELEFADYIYAYGSCIEKQGFIGEEIAVASSPTSPLFDCETNAFIGDSRRFTVLVCGRELVFTPELQEFIALGIEVNPSGSTSNISEIGLLRYLLSRLGSKLFVDPKDLLNKFPRCRRLKSFLQTCWWQHPDIAGGEQPSGNVSMRSLVEALSTDEPSVFREGCPNTHWKFWDSRQRM